MALGMLPKPGTEFGPCLKDCSHSDCKEIRRIAAYVCKYCGKEIGYNRLFYIIEKGEIVHSPCLEDAMERESNPPIYSTELDPDASISDADPGL